MLSGKTLIVSLALASLAMPLAGLHAETTPASDAAPPSRAADIVRMQLQSGATQPAPPPMTGAEATRIYRAYLSRIGQAKAAASDSSDSAAVAPSGK